MATIAQIKAWFADLQTPIEAHYHAWIDSFWHKDEAIPIASVENLQDTLDTLQNQGGGGSEIFEHSEDTQSLSVNSTGGIVSMGTPAVKDDVFDIELNMEIPLLSDIEISISQTDYSNATTIIAISTNATNGGITVIIGKVKITDTGAYVAIYVPQKIDGAFYDTTYYAVTALGDFTGGFVILCKNTGSSAVDINVLYAHTKKLN